MKKSPFAPRVFVLSCAAVAVVACFARPTCGQQLAVFSYDSQAAGQDDAMSVYDAGIGSFLPFDSRVAANGSFGGVATSGNMALYTYNATTAAENDEVVVYDLVGTATASLTYGFVGTDGSFGPVAAGDGMIFYSYDSNVVGEWDLMEVYDVATGMPLSVDLWFAEDGSFGHVAAGDGKAFYSYNSTVAGGTDVMVACDLASGERTDVYYGYDAGGSFGHAATGDGAAAFAYDSTTDLGGSDLMIVHNIADGIPTEIDFGSQDASDGSFGHVAVSGGKVFYTYNSTVAGATDRLTAYDLASGSSESISEFPGLDGSFGHVTVGDGKIFFAYDSTVAGQDDLIVAYDIAGDSLQTIDESFGSAGAFGSIAAGDERIFYSYETSAAGDDDVVMAYDLALATSDVIDGDSGPAGAFGPIAVATGTPKLTSTTSGNFNVAATWGQTTVVPTAQYATLIAGDMVTVAQSGDAFSLAIDAGGTVDVRSGAVLMVVRGLTVAADSTLAGDGAVDAETIAMHGTLAPGGTGGGIGTLTLDNGVMALASSAVYDVEVSLGAVEADLLEVSAAGRVLLGGTLQVTAIDRTDSNLWADVSRTIVHSATGAIGDDASGTGFAFDAVAPAGSHLGQGAFLREVDYVNPGGNVAASVNLDVFIALGGDADGDGKVWANDWNVLRANFG
ncbi:MAG: hypothetical protein HQ567_03820, partial [Candidatus Nealsonbacteria bacterium]|nr:hypothetical protein [Candidatus Nealsonbacteria bacterium]